MDTKKLLVGTVNGTAGMMLVAYVMWDVLLVDFFADGDFFCAGAFDSSSAICDISGSKKAGLAEFCTAHMVGLWSYYN